MIRFKNRDGFSIIEIVITIAIIGTTLMAVFGSLNSSFRSVVKSHDLLTRLFILKKEMVANQFKKPDPFVRTDEKKVARPATTIRYQVTKLPFESSLGKLLNLYLVQATGKWRTLGIPLQERLVGLRTRIPKERKKT